MGKILFECLQNNYMMHQLLSQNQDENHLSQWFQFLNDLIRSISLSSILLLHPEHHTTYRPYEFAYLIQKYNLRNQQQKMIWDIIEQSNFDKHFQNPNLTIEQLLVDENILTQMQNLNPQLLQFINKNLGQVISKLVLYSTIMPREEEGYDRCHRLPYVSSEMLAINSQIFYEAFLPRQGPTTNHLTYLLSFLTSQSASNQLLLGYFEKITNNLYKGRKLEFTKAVSQNLNLFCRHLDKETIGNILKNCVILLGQKQGTLYEERKKIVSTLVTYLVDPNAGNKEKQTQIREVSSMALIQIIGRHKTFSSGDQLLKYLLNSCGQLLIIYSKVDNSQICQFLIGVLNKSTQKIYDPELDDKVSIFRIPPKHQKLLLGYLPLRLHYCQKLVSSGPQKQLLIRQQDGRQVIKVNKQVLDYVTLLAITLQNEIDQFLVESQNYYKFVWQCMCNHPRNDILLTQIDKIFIYAISKRKVNKQQLNHNLFNRFKIIDKICQVFRNQPQEKVLRPHIFQIWSQLAQFAPQQSKKFNIQWKNICEVYQKLVPLHIKAAGLNYNRPTNTKLVVDQQQAGAVKINQFNIDNHEPQITQKHLTNQRKQFTQIQKKLDPFEDFSEQMGHQIHKQQTSSQEQKEIVQKNSDLKQGQGINKQNPFNQFGDFFNNYQPQSQQIIEQDKKITQKTDDFGAFDQFM